MRPKMALNGRFEAIQRHIKVSPATTKFHSEAGLRILEAKFGVGSGFLEAVSRPEIEARKWLILNRFEKKGQFWTFHRQRITWKNGLPLYPQGKRHFHYGKCTRPIRQNPGSDSRLRRPEIGGQIWKAKFRF